MNKFKTILLSLMLLSVVACTKANAVDVGLGYINNNAINVDGTRFTVGSQYKNIRYGLTSTISDGVNKLETYGVYGQLPFKVYDSKFNIVPQIAAEKYREADEKVGSFGLGLEYELVPTVRAQAVALSNRQFNRNKDSKVDGESYLFGITKTF